MMKEYLVCIFAGMTATFLYNFFANLLRAVGNSLVPLVFLAIFTAAAKAAITTAPKLFTSPCIIRIPKFITDCWIQVRKERLKISLKNTLAYMPVQDFGNAFSTFVAQNYGAGKKERIQAGIKSSVISVFVFCAMISLLVCQPLLHLPKTTRWESPPRFLSLQSMKFRKGYMLVPLWCLENIW